MRSRLLALVIGATTLFVGGTSMATATPTDLFFSEYVEGSSFNKAFEIYNGTGAMVPLAPEGYIVEMYFNGATTPNLTIGLQGNLLDGDTYVVTNLSASLELRALADQTTTATNWFNGDDAVVLKRGGAGGTIVDVIGQVGFDPGTEWGGGLVSTFDHTLRRMPGVLTGDTAAGTPFDPSRTSAQARPATIQEARIGGLGLTLIRSACLQLRAAPAATAG